MNSVMSTRCSINRQPARRCLSVSYSRRRAHIVAVLAQQPGPRPRQAIDQRKRTFIEHASFHLPKQALNIFVLPERKQRTRYILLAPAIERRELLCRCQPQSSQDLREGSNHVRNSKRPRLFRSFK